MAMDPDHPQDRGGPGWLATSGLACRIGRHWPVAALASSGQHARISACADCGRPMHRLRDGRWRVTIVAGRDVQRSRIPR